MRVNPGGAGQDDGGLPPVDIEIPDDARELEREVLAYRRELRARRRRARWHRIGGPLRGHGALLPLVASCVALSMLAGTLLSVFSISPASAPVLSHSASASPSPRTGSGLPAGTVLINHRPTSVRSLVPAVLVLVSSRCDCAQAVQEVTAQARQAGVRRVYLVGTDNMADVTQLARTAGSAVVAVEDAKDVLDNAYRPAGLTIVLAREDSTTSVQRHLERSPIQLEDQLRQFEATAQGASPTPGSAVSVLPTPT